MESHEGTIWQAGRMLASVVLCYALVLQGLFGSLASASPQSADASAFMTVICHTVDSDVGGSKTPAKDLPARHHCVLCETGALAFAIPPLSSKAATGLIVRSSATVHYVGRQETSGTPLYLPQRVSRGPPRMA